MWANEGPLPFLFVAYDDDDDDDDAKQLCTPIIVRRPLVLVRE